MANEIRCKRIIDGKTYNTETSTQLGYWDGGDTPLIEALYQSRHGTFFLYHLDETRHTSDPLSERIIPRDPGEAQKWMETYCSAEALERVFGEMPEAGEAEARVTLRIPESLRKRIATLAEQRNQSVNAWILRCLELCAARTEDQRN